MIGRCESCGSTTICEKCAGQGAPPPRETYFKCASCGCVCEELYRSKWEPTMCEVCEHGVFEFYGAVCEGDEGKVAEDIKNKKV